MSNRKDDNQRVIDHADTFAGIWRMLSPQGAPEPEREYRFARPQREFRFDFAWVKNKVAVEIDGGQWARFGGRHATDGDREKLNLAAELGWRVLRYSPKQLEINPRAIIMQVCMCLTINSLDEAIGVVTQ